MSFNQTNKVWVYLNEHTTVLTALSIDKVQNIVNRNVLNLYYRIFKIESPARSYN